MKDKTVKDTLSARSSGDYRYGRFSESTFRPGQGISLVAWNTEEGRKRLHRCKHAEAFYHLAQFFQPQINPVYCGVASAVIALNTLRIPKDRAVPQTTLSIPVPQSEENLVISFVAFAQSTFLNERTEPIKPRAVIEYRAKDENGAYRPGLGLLELEGLLRAYDTKTESHFGSALTAERFREYLQADLAAIDRVLISHFRSDLMGGIPRGHISPLAAYDEVSDSVLVLDVAGHKSPWYWAPCEDLLLAMQATYDTQPLGGGLLLVSEG